ncbi:MAG: hypothetical protein Q8P74_02090 [bacterium]|nr:hypothetical protein [bacterium]
MKKLILVGFIFVFLSPFSPVLAQDKIEIEFFYSPICIHCAAEHKFLDEIEKDYPEVIINRHDATQIQNYDLMRDMAEERGVERYLGTVPLTFVGQEFFVGFDNKEGIGKDIENSIKRQLGEGGESPFKEDKVTLPIIGEVNLADYSLPVLAILLGLLDGFNICSLGALVLILGMVLVLRSRKKIMLFGGLFILTTALVYGLLIVLWYKIFSLFVPYLRIMEITIGLLGVGGAIYFLRQFFRFKKYGPACDTGSGNSMINKLSFKMQEMFKNPASTLALFGSIFLFAFLLTVIEFPCSAVVPVTFAGILAKAQMSLSSYLFYIAVFVLFYMLDEVIVFLIAVSKMTVWIASGKFVTWIYLIEGIFLLLLGIYYLF